VKSTLENPIELQVVQLAWDYLGILGSKLKVLGDTSWPDRIFWLPGGKPLLIEFKRTGFDPQPKQSDTHESLKALGYDIQVHDNAASAFQAIIDAVAPSCVSAQSRKILVRARRCCAVLRSRAP
jgi:hypothetical protein